LQNVRNIGIMAHIDAGKTTVSERILFYSGKIHRMGEVHDGEATMDFMDQERERGITITSAAATTMWRDHQITLIDTPGHVDFTAEVERSLRVLDGAVALFCAVGGVQPQSEQVWRQSEKYGVPKIAFINKLDRVGADFYAVIGEIRDEFQVAAVPIAIPMGQEDRFQGMVDLVRMKAVRYDETGKGSVSTEIEIPASMREEAAKWRHRLMEASAEQDDMLLEAFLSRGELSPEEIVRGLRKGTLARKLVPVLGGSALKNKGVQSLLDAVVDFLPSPLETPIPVAEGELAGGSAGSDDGPFAALAFKIISDRHIGKLTLLRIYSGRIGSGTSVWNSTRRSEQRIARIVRMYANRQEALEDAGAGDIVGVIGLSDVQTGDTLCLRDKPIVLESMEFPAPVVSISLKAGERSESDRLSAALRRLADEDPTFVVGYDEETAETVVSGMGELHLEVLVERMRREYGVNVQTGRPEVAYRETATVVAEGEYKHVKQTGGHGQYGHVRLILEPMPPGESFEFVNEIRSGRIPAEYIASVEKGVVKAMRRGPHAGYPVVDVRVRLVDGSYHEVDSSDMAFQEAALMGFRQVFLKTQPDLLEPVMSVEVVVPEEFMGAAAGSICQRRGRIESMEQAAGARVLYCFVPLAEMFGYAGVIRTLTQGRGSFTMHFERYEAVPFEIERQIVEKRIREKRVPGA